MIFKLDEIVAVSVDDSLLCKGCFEKDHRYNEVKESDIHTEESLRDDVAYCDSCHELIE